MRELGIALVVAEAEEVLQQKKKRPREVARQQLDLKGHFHNEDYKESDT